MKMLQLSPILVTIACSFLISNNLKSEEEISEEEIDFHFEIFSLKENVATAICQRLSSGSAGTSEALARLPEMASKRLAESEAAVNLKIVVEEKGSGSSSESKLNALKIGDEGSLEYTDGLEVSLRPKIVENTSLISFDLQAVYAKEAKKDRVKIYRVDTPVIVENSIPGLCAYWFDQGEHRILVAKATRTEDTSNVPSGKFSSIYLDAGFFSSANSSKNYTDCVARTIIPTISGEKASSELSVPFGFKVAGDAIDMAELGLALELTTALSKDRLKLSSKGGVKFAKETGKTERGIDDYKIPEIEFREAAVLDVIQVGVGKNFPSVMYTFHKRSKVRDQWVLKLNCYSGE